MPKKRIKSHSELSQHAARMPSMLRPIVDFLIGSRDSDSQSKSDEGNRAAPCESELHKIVASWKGVGLQSAIRDKGRIVPTRLQSQQVGEDAYFLKEDAIGIADGVGGWASCVRADPALFSRLLMHFCFSELNRLDTALVHEVATSDAEKTIAQWMQCDPIEVLQVAWERCVRASKREGIMGSSTALLAVLRGNELRVANMGDCVLMLIRDGRMLFRTSEQQHSFNFPVQLGMMDATAESVSIASALCMHRNAMIPDGGKDNELTDVTQTMRDLIYMYDHTSYDPKWDNPHDDAGNWSIKVQEGDIVIMASDGLLDNLFDEEILGEIRAVLAKYRIKEASDIVKEIDLPYSISKALCRAAKVTSEDPRVVVSPFQQQASEEGLYYAGGKNDDITVLSAVVAHAEYERV
ncbi:protein-serine/threonine phosphatase [Malassezia vespertilionis]|uniref:Protein phosphatase n=1 Tax=Malassezia vespertilionis TaxID=2020962 RepID=A0A2N1JAK1_9BASI|nr:protein-serine/threonine phosphatase [Malassezia vespertilionis]PKI83575.1 hypothetical protein MVES_002449 [Malassezia vespertilionis]WFD07235.1 protein-serine/threonine phosphatase [Malassezia vespertilionis]